MHETLHPDIKAHIDEKTLFNKQVYVRGWAFHSKLGALPLRVAYNDIFSDVEVMPRKDVCQFYNRLDITICGWRFKVPENTLCVLQMNVEEKWVNILPINTRDSNKSSVEIIDDISDISESSGVSNLDKISISPQPKSVEGTTNVEGAKSVEAIMDTNVNVSAPQLTTSLDTRISDDINPPRYVVVDNFYKNPDSVRNFALSLDFKEHKEYHKGKRTELSYRFPGLKESFEKILGAKITNWDYYPINGCFQHCIAGDQLVYHCDLQHFAGIIYLTPDAPPQTGTSFYRSRHTRKMKVDGNEQGIVFRNGFLDPTEFDLVDTVGNVYNRLILFDSKLIHSASEYFGTNLQNSRLFQLFFFDIEGYNRTK